MAGRMTGAEVPLEGNRSEDDTAVSLCSGKNGVEPMTLCAPAIPGESLISQVSRYHVTSGNLTTRDTYDELFQRAPFRLTFWVPPHIASLSVWLKGELVETTHRLLRESTLFPLFKMFNGARFAPSASRESVDEALRRQPKRIVAESGWTRICPLCVIKDSEKYGTAVIRSAHQIPGVSHCHLHGTPLQDRCQKCRCPFERKNDLVLTPWLGCAVCEARLVGDPSQTEAVPDDSRAIGFARFAARLLEWEGSPATRHVLVNLYKRRLKELGLVRKSTVDRVKLSDELQAFFGGSLLARLDPALRLDRLTGWFHILVASATWETPLGRHLLLTYFLYEDAGAFLAQYGDAVRLPVHVLKTRRRSQQAEAASAGAVERDVMQELLQSAKLIPDCDLDALWREHYGLMKRLVRHDADALSRLEQRLAASSARRERVPEGGIREVHADDVDWAAKIRQAAAEFYASPERPQKASCNRMLKLVGWRKGTRPDKVVYPQFSRELMAHVESPWHFYLRRILWELGQPAAREGTASRLTRRSGVEHHRAVAVLGECHRRGVPSGLKPSTVLTTIREWEIDLQWDGPCPDRIFPLSGRSHQQHRSSVPGDTESENCAR